MNVMAWLIVGGVIGCVGALTVGTDSWRGILANVFVGILGALMGGWLISPLIGAPTIVGDTYDLPAFAVSLACAGSLLVIFNLVSRIVRG